MAIHLRPADPERAAAALQQLGPAAQQVADAVDAAVAELRTLAERAGHAPDDFRTALAAVVTYRRRQAAVDDAVARMLSVLEAGGVTRNAMFSALGVRAQTLQKMLAPCTGRGSGDG